MKLLFIDRFLSNKGGAELYNDVLVALLIKHGVEVDCDQPQFVDGLDDYDKILLSDFWGLTESNVEKLQEREYYILEHGHSYHKSKLLFNLLNGERLACSEEDLVYVNLYQNARAVFTQSEFHRTILRCNLGYGFPVENLNGQIWSEDIIDHVEGLALKRSLGENIINGCFIMGGRDQAHSNVKGVTQAVSFCEEQQFNYYVCPPTDSLEFLTEMAKYRYFCFFPAVPETYSRTVAEAFAMGVQVIGNELIGCIPLFGPEKQVNLREISRDTFKKIYRVLTK